MPPSDSRFVLLMIHGVNSTLEWSTTVLRVLGPHFHPRLIRYRYFHTLWGPVKVYVWPAAFLLLVAFGILEWARAGSRLAFSAVLGLLLFETAVVVHAEIQWMLRVEKQPPVWMPPIVFCFLGVGAAFWFSYPWHWVWPIACMVAVAAYLDLREYGGLKFAMPALIGLPGLLALGAGWLVWAFLIRSDPRGLIVVALTGLMEPFLRTRLAFAQVAREMEKAQRDHVMEPFVVAHSLGTYLTAHVLQERENLKLGRILFTGCVLDRRFPLEKLVLSGNERLLSLTNHVGRIDLVPLATGGLRGAWCLLTLPGRILPAVLIDLIRHLIGWRALGGAGFRGFKNRSDVVHTVKPTSPCPECSRSTARIHNVDHGWVRHSTLNKDPAFQEWYWVPSLWGIDVHQYREWKEVCEKGYFHEQRPHPGSGATPVSARKYEEELLAHTWSWPSSPELAAPRGRMLEEYVQEYLAAIESRVPAKNLMKRLPKFLFDTVAGAFAESKKETGNPNVETLSWLHPQFALQFAVLAALQAEKRN